MNHRAHAPLYRIRYSLENGLSHLIAPAFHRKKLPQTLARARESLSEEELQRVDHYNKLDAPFHLHDPTCRKNFHHKGQSSYRFDLHRILRHFDPTLPFRYYFGDKFAVPSEPCFIKARPLDEDHRHSVIMRLNSKRHYFFPPDPVPFEKKRNVALWRGTVANNPLRQALVERHRNTPNCDVKGTNRRTKKYEGSVPKISILEQLQCKFLISLEGNDVATNTKWIMNSNSLCLMPRPRRESWFGEGRLVPGMHYVPLADDFSDLEEKIDHYASHPDEAREIVARAQAYCRLFQDRKRDEWIGILVAAKYLHFCLDAEFQDPGRPPL